MNKIQLSYKLIELLPIHSCFDILIDIDTTSLLLFSLTQRININDI